MEYRITENYKSNYTDPITLSAGDTVLLGREETEEKWKGWIWAEHKGKSGWIPLQIVEKDTDGRGRITKDYTARELDVRKGEKVIVLEKLNGWLWVMDMHKQEGWIPAEIASEHKNHLGRISLMVAVSGLVVTETLLRTGIADGPVMQIINTGFEGGTVGGLADWFAVSALFREIPIPYVRRHTNIIVKNRTKISEGVVDLVTNRWLSPEVLKEKLSSMDVSTSLSNYLSDPGNIEKVTDFMRKEVLTRLSQGLDSAELSSFIEKLIKDQTAKLDLAKPLGNWLRKAVNSGSHNELIERMLGSLSKSLNDPEFTKMLDDKVRSMIDDYKTDGILKDVFVTLAERTNIIDRKMIVQKLLAGLNDFIDELRHDRGHPARNKFNEKLIEFADGLVSGDPSSVKLADTLKKKITENAELGNMIRDFLSKSKTSLDEQLLSNDTALMKLVARNIDSAAKEFRSNKESMQRFNTWVMDTAIELIHSHHHKIGEMVRESLSKLDDRALVQQIEEKVGNDLQFIRLNGAVIGFFAGCAIKVIKLLV